jgi:hypothetical protein
MFLVCASVSAQSNGAPSNVSPDTLLQRGIDAYRADDFSAAVLDLQAAAQMYLSPERMEAYVNTGRFEHLASFEKSLVYLTLAQYRLGRESDARETVVRLTTAERIEPTYARLPLDPDAADFEAIAARLVPTAELPRNVALAHGSTNTALPAVRAAETPVQPTAVQPTLAAEKSERQKLIDEMVARERERIEREADARIASEREKLEAAAETRIAEAQRANEQQLAAEQAEAERQTQARLAAAQAEAQRQAEGRLAAERIAAQREAEERIAAERAAAQRLTEERIAAERASAQQQATARVGLADALTRGAYLTNLRQAEAFATNDQVALANDIYNRIAQESGVPREVLAEAAVGLYRTGAFRDSTSAFARMAPFAKGEEDLRYYYAVALYEIGSFADAKRELACALPFIQVTEDVTRYRAKIEQSSGLQARND